MRRAVKVDGRRARPAEAEVGGQPISIDRWRRVDLETRSVLEMVAAARGVPASLLLHPSRCKADVAAARQLAMYLVHVVLRRPYRDVGRCFGRDRTTVAYACAHIEDLRDVPEVDSEVAALELRLAGDVEPEALPHAAC